MKSQEIKQPKMRLLVSCTPYHPEDCIFSVLPPNKKSIPNCPFRCRDLGVDPNESFSNEPNDMNCLRAQNHYCVYMDTESYNPGGPAH